MIVMNARKQRRVLSPTNVHASCVREHAMPERERRRSSRQPRCRNLSLISQMLPPSNQTLARIISISLYMANIRP
jgi:hypothetical protein